MVITKAKAEINNDPTAIKIIFAMLSSIINHGLVIADWLIVGFIKKSSIISLSQNTCSIN